MADERTRPSPLAPAQRRSVARKREVVMRLLRGEPLDPVSRALGEGLRERDEIGRAHV